MFIVIFSKKKGRVLDKTRPHQNKLTFAAPDNGGRDVHDYFFSEKAAFIFLREFFFLSKKKLFLPKLGKSWSGKLKG